MYEDLATSLQTVLAHALAALEYEERDEPEQSLHEYHSAWCTLSCALELQGAASGTFPNLVRETCAALLATYSSRYEAIQRRSLEGGCHRNPRDSRPLTDVRGQGDVGRSSPGRHRTASSSVYPGDQSHAGGESYCTAQPYEPRVEDSGVAGLDPNRGDVSGDRCSARQPPPPSPTGASRADHGGRGDLPGTQGAAGAPEAARTGHTTGQGWGSGVASVAMTEHMSQVLAQCQRPVAEGASLDDLAGLESVKSEVRLALLLPMRMPHLFQGIRQPARNFLLYGPPGTGKTMLVERIAAEAGATLLVLTPGAVLSKWSGESEKQLRAVFEVARAMQPCIVFMDEVDSLAPARGSGDDPVARRLLNELLVQMSCLAAGYPGSGCGKGGGGGGGGTGVAHGDLPAVYVFAATNRIQDCDPALLRRFDRRVAVPMPDLAAREAFLVAVLERPEVAGHLLVRQELQQLAERTEGYSGSDLAQLCREAAMQPVREVLQGLAASGWGRWMRSEATLQGGAGPGEADLDQVPRPLCMEDFEMALATVRPVDV